MSRSQSRDTQRTGSIDTMGSVPQTRGTALQRIYHNNKGVFLILLAEVVGSAMDAIARFLQLGGVSMHPFQVGLLQFFISLLTAFLNIYCYARLSLRV
jgi:hypothetical protein